MLVEEITPISISPCGHSTLRARGRFSADIQALFPYLRAVLGRAAVYHPDRPSLTFRQGPYTISLYPQGLGISGARSTTEALKVMAEVRDLINDTYKRRHSILVQG